MIGNFEFVTDHSPGAVMIEMSWCDGERTGKVIVPWTVVPILRSVSAPILEREDIMGLSIALGYGVSVAGLTRRPLRLSGDLSVWPVEWGNIVIGGRRPDRAPPAASLDQDAM